MTVTSKTGTTSVETLPASTYVEIISVDGAWADVRLAGSWTGYKLRVSRSELQAEPRVYDPPGMFEVPTPSYVRHEAPLWHDKPKEEDVRQGVTTLGDCTLMAAMAALASTKPELIMSLFSPHTASAPTYQIVLHCRNKAGRLERHVEAVDTEMPVDSPDSGRLLYADIGTPAADHNQPLWPALLEKAFAQMYGGYELLIGSSLGLRFEQLTGQQAEQIELPASDADLLAWIRTAEGKHAMTAGSRMSARVDGESGFQRNGDAFELDIAAKHGSITEIVPGSLTVTHPSGPGGAIDRVLHDAGEALAGASATAHSLGTEGWGVRDVPTARDDGKGNIVGAGVTGTVQYDYAHMQLNYDKSVTAVTAEGLRASYERTGLLDDKLGIICDHAYTIDGVGADGLIRVRNPYGTETPTLTVSQFRQFFMAVCADAPVSKKPAV